MNPFGTGADTTTGMMNIYIHLEILDRELDGKLLLALVAASKGATVLITDLETITYVSRRRLLEPGIFHTKSLGPAPGVQEHLQWMRTHGHAITSQDEEHGLLDMSYDRFLHRRFARETIAEADRVFCWGEHDHEALTRVYPDATEKFVCSGSPRVDYWTSQLAAYWSRPTRAPVKPYVLIVSSFQVANHHERLWDLYALNQRLGSFDNDPSYEHQMFKGASEEVLLVGAFRSMAETIARRVPEMTVVVRPHPAESAAAWRQYLKGCENVHVIGGGPITAWVRNAAAVVQHGCTTALEAVVSGVPLITYKPFPTEAQPELATRVGWVVESEQEVVEALQTIAETGVQESGADAESDFAAVAGRLCFDEHTLNASRIVTSWRDLTRGWTAKSNRWWLIKLYIRCRDTWLAMKRIGVKLIFPNRRTRAHTKNWKFPAIQYSDLNARAERLRAILDIDASIHVRKLGKRAVLVEKR